MEKVFDYEVGIIGAGIVGAFTFDTLVTNGVKTCLCEAGEDVSLGASKANSAIIHAGYDPIPGSNMARLNVKGNKMYEEVAERLGEKLLKCGSIVVADETGLDGIKELYERGLANGVSGLKILNKEELHALEPNLNDNLCYGLLAKTAKVVSPYNFTISLCEEAIINGGTLKLDYPVDKLEFKNGGWKVSSGKNSFTCHYLVNCAGAGCDKINELAGAEKLNLTYTLGEYILLDKSEHGLVNRPIFPMPTKLGKGILVAPTVAGNIICGPTAKLIDKYSTRVTSEGVIEIREKTKNLVNGIDFRKAIKLYAGVRVKEGKDFILGFSKLVPNFYITAGICSPGLASAPAIADEILQNLQKCGVKTHKIAIKRRKPYINTQNLTEEEFAALIAKNPKFGKLICRCEGITEGEIEQVLKGVITPLTVEGIKRRLRATMGRCQGSFCLPMIIDIMAKYYKIDPSQVIIRGKTSLVTSRVKEAGIYSQKEEEEPKTNG
ncbi:MAG: FAD-dependent oxidoreductase [Clostridia bacterium]|nr:FAD-dependent oxidoreductase [Clostridia bacterium]